MRRVCGPNMRDWYAAGGLIEEGTGREAVLVTVGGRPPLALVPEGLSCPALDKEIGALLPELARRAEGEVCYLGRVRAMVAKLSAAVPALLSGLVGAKLLHICAWDGLTSAIEALLALPNYFVS
jgi:hypothetical protein